MFTDGFDVVYMLRFDLESILHHPLWLCMLTIIESLFDNISKTAFIMKRKLVIDI